MALLIGTDAGVYRSPDVRFDDAARPLEANRVMRIRQFPGADGVFACSQSGLHRSTDGGTTWTELNTPREEVYSVRVSPDRECLYAGTHPAHLYVSEDEGDTWRELESFQALPSRDEWYTPRHRNEAHVRSLEAHPAAPDRLIAGVEVGGVHVSDDRGESWTERRTDLDDDVHHVLLLGPEEYVASCGGGLYRTRDAGASWTRLDDQLAHTYFREALFHDGRLYAAAARDSPPSWDGANGADGGLYVSEDSGASFRSITYPGQPREVILAWAVADGAVIAGTNEGRILREESDSWETIGSIAARIRSLCVV
ncbi:MAG: WD40/YVTN/BNR-like repeat-containing protein [Halodesulfurarchaeum sp.]